MVNLVFPYARPLSALERPGPGWGLYGAVNLVPVGVKLHVDAAAAWGDKPDFKRLGVDGGEAGFPGCPRTLYLAFLDRAPVQLAQPFPG